MQVLKRVLKGMRKYRRIGLVGACVVVGAGIILLSHAATAVLSLEPENGTASANIQSVTSNQASGGRYIKFKAPVTPPGGSEALHTCYPNAFCNSQNVPQILSGFNLRDIGSDTYMTKHASLTQLQKIKSKGFNVVRLAMQWEQFQPSAGTSGFNSAKFDKLNTIIANAKTAGVYVILDPIHGTGRGNCSGTDGHIPAWAQVTSGGVCQQRIGAINANSKDYIQKIASDYRTNPTVIAIDLANEVQSINYTDDVGLLTMYNRLIGYVREVDSDKIVMIEPQAGERLLSADAIANTISNKANVVYSSHDYFGGAYDASGNLLPGCGADGYASSNSSCPNRNSTDANGDGYPNPTKNKASLEAHIQRQLTMLDDPRVKLPLFIGEYDCSPGLLNASQWRSDIVALYKKYNLSRTNWAFYNRGSSYPGDPPASNHSATQWTSPSDDTPGAWYSWINELL